MNKTPLLIFITASFLYAFEITAEINVALLPFKGMDTTINNVWQLPEYMPRYILDHSLNDSISIVPFDTVLKMLDKNGIPRYDNYSLENLEKLCSALSVRVLLVSTIDSFKINSILESTRQPYVEIGIEIIVRYYDFNQKSYCWGKDTLKAKTFRIERNKHRETKRKSFYVPELTIPILTKAVFDDIRARITQQFYSKVAVMLCQIDRDTGYQNKIVAGDQPRIVDIQDQNVFIYISMKYGGELKQSYLENGIIRQPKQGFQVYTYLENRNKSITGRIQLRRLLSNDCWMASIVEGIETIAPRQWILIPE